ncbi:MAG: hypothetical protein Q9159_000305 [Coniocarpon cinnabarinum]
MAEIIVSIEATVVFGADVTATEVRTKLMNAVVIRSGDDLTHGFVDYVGADNATKTGLVQVGPQSVVLGADHTPNVSLSSRGRPSVRLEAKKDYTHGLFIFSLSHMPFGCGTWPALWTLGPDWPNAGEIDILEGVNQQQYNWATLHTSSNCTVAGVNETGLLQTNDCSEKDATSGCIVQSRSKQSYGAAFNSNSGGVYAMQWTSNFIRVWFFPHGAVPSSITANTPDPAKDFGKPMANFQGSCDIDRLFHSHHAVIDLTFCGDWAGNTYGSSGCPMSVPGNSKASCEAFVAKHPEAFKEAYWDINYLKVFQTVKGVSSSSSSISTITHSVSPVASSRSVSSQSVGMGASSKVKSSSLVSMTRSIPPSSIRTSLMASASSTRSSGSGQRTSTQGPSTGTKLLSASHGTSSTHKQSSSTRLSVSHTTSNHHTTSTLISHTTNTHHTSALNPSAQPFRLQPTPSHLPPTCNALYAPPPLPPRRTALTTNTDTAQSTSETATSASSSIQNIPFDTTSTLAPINTNNPDAMNAVTFHIYCDSLISGLPIIQVIHLRDLYVSPSPSGTNSASNSPPTPNANRNDRRRASLASGANNSANSPLVTMDGFPAPTGEEKADVDPRTFGPDEAFVACLSHCSSLSPQECAGVGFWNGTETGWAACRVHGFPSTHALVAAPDLRRNGTGSAVNGTLGDRSRLRPRSEGEKVDRRQDIGNLLTTHYHSGSFAAVRATAAPVSDGTVGGGGEGVGKTVASGIDTAMPTLTTGAETGIVASVEAERTVTQIVTVTTAAEPTGCSSIQMQL